jgi:hypothetical protein
MTILTHRATKTVVPAEHAGEIPPLESGDRLTRAEFMRRYVIPWMDWDERTKVDTLDLIQSVVRFSSSTAVAEQSARPSGWAEP